MKKKTSHLIYPFILMGLFLVFANSCKKDDDVPVLTTTAVTDITQTTVKSGGNITSDGGSAVTARGVCWSTDPDPTISDNKTTDGAGTGEFISNITGLMPNTTYYVRAYATNSNGTGYGSVLSFTTAEEITSLVDPRDNTVYEVVTIGSQIWMAENLRYLPSVVGPGTGSQTEAYYYVYGYDGTSVEDAKATENYTIYGVLYNWTAAMNGASSSATNPSGVQGVCPPGWHLPSHAEWTQLTDFLGGHGVAGGKLKEEGTAHWNSPNTGATNITGFTALPGGQRRPSGGIFNRLNEFGTWWSASEMSSTHARSRDMQHNLESVVNLNQTKDYGFSVRCIKDN